MSHPLNASAVLAAMLLSVGLAPPVAAQPFKDRAQCLAKAEAAPDFALVEAELWERRFGGGTDARLCQAMALLLAGEWTRAATLFEAVLPLLVTTEPASLRANLWGRVGLAWDRAKQPEKALSAFAQGIELAPDDVDLRLDRALALAGQERFWDALADLDRAVSQAPERVDARLLRAQTRARLGQGGDARRDLDAVLDTDPRNARALLMRGALRAEQGDRAGARADWTSAAALTGDPEAAREAAGNLEALDAFDKAVGQAGPSLPSPAAPAGGGTPPK